MTPQNVLKSEQNSVCIHWNKERDERWQACLSKVQKMNLLQSEDYVHAMAKANQQRIQRCLITIEGQDAGLCTILEAGLFKNAFHGVILDRGPLWFPGYGSPANFKDFTAAFAQQYPNRFGRRRRFIPEIIDKDITRQSLQEVGFKHRNTHGYETIWLDIRPELEILRKNLNPKWRNKLNQSGRKSLELLWSDGNTNSTAFKWLMAQYIRDRAQRKYDGPSFKTMKMLGESFSRGKNMLIACALLDKKPIAGILFFIHGASATYQIGYTSDVGRENRAHYALLWEALEALKKRGVQNLDLGGVNEEGAKGVKTFKKGMGGKVEKTMGLYY